MSLILFPNLIFMENNVTSIQKHLSAAMQDSRGEAVLRETEVKVREGSARAAEPQNLTMTVSQEAPEKRQF